MPDSRNPDHANPDHAAIDALTEGEAIAELERLAAAMGEAERLYFRDDAPTLTDAEYDALKRRNLAIEARFPDLVRPDSPSRRVGAAPSEQFSPVAHGVPMLSLDNAFNDEEVAEFAVRIRRFLRLDSAEEPMAFTVGAQDRRPLRQSIRYEHGRAGAGRHPRRRAGAARTSPPTSSPCRTTSFPSGWRGRVGRTRSRCAARSTSPTPTSSP